MTFVLFCLYLLYKLLSNLCFGLFISSLQNIRQLLICLVFIFFTKYQITFVLFCLISSLQNIKTISCIVLSYIFFTKYQTTFVLFCRISSLQNIRQPLFCFVFIFYTKYQTTFVLFCLYLLYKIIDNLCFVLSLSSLQNIR